MNHNLVCKEDQQEYSVCRFYNDVVKNIVYGKQCKSILTYLKKVSGLQLQPIKKEKKIKSEWILYAKNYVCRVNYLQ